MGIRWALMFFVMDAQNWGSAFFGPWQRKINTLLIKMTHFKWKGPVLIIGLLCITIFDQDFTKELTVSRKENNYTDLDIYWTIQMVGFLFLLIQKKNRKRNSLWLHASWHKILCSHYAIMYVESHPITKWKWLLNGCDSQLKSKHQTRKLQWINHA